MSEIVIPTKEIADRPDPLPHSPWEQEYWETWNSGLGLPEGTVFDSKSYDRWWNGEKVVRRQRNVAQATGRVNGKFMRNGKIR